MSIKQSLAWWCFSGKGVPDAELLAAAKKIGYQGVEILPPDKLELVRDAGLTISSHGGHRLEKAGLNDPAFHSEIEDSILSNLEVAKKYDIPTLIVFSGDRRPGLSDEEGIENAAAGLRRVAPAAEAGGVNLVIELLNSRVDHPGYMCDRTAWGVAVCEKVGSPRVKLLYDIYHMQIMEGDIIRTIRDNHPHFAHYHTAGNPGRRDLDDTQELLYPPIIKAIKDTGYEGYIAHEFTPKGDPIQALETAYRLCDL